jgi:hypothetical protein
MKFERLLERWQRRELSQAEAAEALGMSERSFRRWHTRWLEEGEAGLRDRRIGQPSPRRMAGAAKAEVCRLFGEVYPDHTVKHFHEQLVKRHAYRLGYTVTKLTLHAAGLVKPAVRRGAHRKKRPRRPLPGMLLFQDGSRFAWLPGSERQLDLIVTLDDATSEIYSAFLIAEEGTASSFLGLAETIAAQGLFCALYTDRGSHYFHTPAAGGKVDKTLPTQVGRALAQLGIEHIASYSPEARGRMERVFRTLQDRLPKELRLAGIGDDVEAANRFIRDVYLPAHNARFAVAAEQPGSAFVPAHAAQWCDLLCLPGRARGRQRQHRALLRPGSAAARKPAAAPLRTGDGARPRVPRRHPRPLPWPALPGALSRRWQPYRAAHKARRPPLAAPGLWVCGRRNAAHIPTGPASTKAVN